jgi:tetratricopeptide (TPR) repeat protein
LKDYRKAEEHLRKTLRVLPYQPNANYDLALVYAESGKEKKALDHLNKALYVWAEADTDYIPAKRAREKLAELQATK